MDTMSAEEDSYVPTEEVTVAKFGSSVVNYTQNPDAKGWIVKRKTDSDKPFRFWILSEEHDTVRRVYPETPIEEGRGAFIWGRPLLSFAIPIYTYGTSRNRPKFLYRLTHDGQPHDGIKARGYGRVNIDPFSFHVLVLKHLDWRCRNPSPFLSTTNSRKKIDHVHKLYANRGFQNIRLIKFRTYGPGWDHKKQRMYHVPTLLKELHDRSPRYLQIMDCEYLIEGEIPRQSIIRESSYGSGHPQPPKKKPTPPKRKSTDPEDEGRKRRRAKGFKPLI
ncbi:hypothetical protein CIB48_g2707 [Xylaria polymorpha]|nr:hypothetical protein CIB48_g2707 [Xylaria polymorpha]